MAKERYPGEHRKWKPSEPAFDVTLRNDYTNKYMFPSMERINDITDWVSMYIWDAIHYLDT